MKRIAIVFGVVVVVFAVAVWGQTPAQPKSGSVEQELIKLEKEWGDALVKRDVAFLDRILADDYTSTDADGNVFTKTENLELLKSGEYVLLSTVADDWKVRVYGDAVVYMARSTDKAQFKGKDISGQCRWTDTWVRRAGRWQCVATHVSRIAQK